MKTKLAKTIFGEKRAALLVCLICACMGLGTVFWAIPQATKLTADLVGSVVSVCACLFFSGWAWGIFLKR